MVPKGEVGEDVLGQEGYVGHLLPAFSAPVWRISQQRGFCSLCIGTTEEKVEDP
jgi:hypothetical protein